MDLTEFLEIFLEEADEHLEATEKLLLAIDVSAPETEALHGVFRAVHSIKGGASTFGMPEIAEVAHVLENLLDRIRKGQLAITTAHVEVFLAAKDVLRAMLDARRNGDAHDADASRAMMALLQRQAQGDSSAPASPAPPASTTPAPPSTSSNAAPTSVPSSAVITTPSGDALVAQALADKSFGLFESPEGLGTSTTAPTTSTQFTANPATVASPASQAIPPASDGTATTPQTANKLPDRAKPTAESSSIRVGVEKVDALINLVGELVITHAMIEQLASELEPGLHQRLLNSISHLARNTREIQTAAMGIRMLPMEVVFSRFPRMVRDLTGKLGKKVELITQGASTELDKSLTERLMDPLTHLVRNSVDHGLEMPEVRMAAGKSEVGRLTLSAAHQGGCIVIEVTDDGAGLNRQRIMAKARQQGFVLRDDMPDEDVWPLIFAPGFSTAEVVTDVSGRGVGMDVVKQNITSMGGSVEIHSAPGCGTTMRIALPLTLAILDGMSVRVGREIYVIGLSHIVESLQPTPEMLKAVLGERSVIRVREEYLPLVSMHTLFGVQANGNDLRRSLVVVIEAEGRKVGLLVDELVGQQQVVVKSLETHFRRISGVAGATILGDGSVALILDAPSLVRRYRDAIVTGAKLPTTPRLMVEPTPTLATKGNPAPQPPTGVSA